MIKELRVHNFRTLINASFRFQRRHLLIGKNNTGKTNLGLAISFPRLVAEQTIHDAVSMNPGAYWDFCNYAIGDKDRVCKYKLLCEVDFRGAPLSYEYDFSVRVGDPRHANVQSNASSIQHESLLVSGGGFKGTPLIENDGAEVRLLHEQRYRNKEPDCYVTTRAPRDSSMLAKLYELETNPAAIAFRNSLKGIAYFNLSSDRIRWGWRESRNDLGLSSSGDNLALMIYQLKTAQESRYRRVIESVRRFDPRLVAINHLTGPDQNVMPIVELEGNRTASWASLSDGTLRAIALSYLFEYAAFAGTGSGAPSPVLIIEEPENCLFVGGLQTMMDEAEATASTAQIIFTTHSPYFIELFDADLDAVTLLRREEWHTTSSTLGDRRADIESSLKTMSLGEQYFRDLLE